MLESLQLNIGTASAIVCQMPRRLTGSSPVVGSSRTTTDGVAIMAQPAFRVHRFTLNPKSEAFPNTS